VGAPDDWIGREVMAAMTFSGGVLYIGTPEGLDERGVVLRHEIGEEHPEIHAVFYPWRVVS